MREHPFWILDAAGDPQPIDDVAEWARWLATADRHVAQDMDEGAGAARVRVSTVFVGLSHRFAGGPPVLWETRILGGPLDGTLRHYPTRAEALAGHAALCACVRGYVRR